jgi:putative membrane-bound dehydrogenase-like protein
MIKLYHLLPCLALVTPLFADEPPTDFKAIFNGKDLTGWNGEPGRWSVEDGAITGTVLPEHPLKTNSFLVWQGGEQENFELRMKVRWPQWEQSKGMRNSGIQIRSVVLPAVHPWSVGGYQYDLSPGGELDGLFYEERSQRGLGVAKGDGVVIQPDGERWRVASLLGKAELNALRKPETEWSDCGIVAVGNRITFTMNGTKVMELTDHDARYRRLSGIIALQIHIGGAMKVQFKDLWFKPLPTGGIEAPLAKVPANAVNAGAESLRSSTSDLLKTHDAKKLAWAQEYRPGMTRVWPTEGEFQNFAKGDSATVLISEPTAADLERWKKLAADYKAEWIEKPLATLVTKLPDGSEARLPIASWDGRYSFASLGTGKTQPEKPATGSIPLNGKAPDAIPLVQAGPAEAKRGNLALNAKASASSEEADKGNVAAKAVDGKPTRWSSSKAQNGEWLAVDLGKPQPISGYRVTWESDVAVYRHKVEISDDNQLWKLAADASQIEEAGPRAADFTAAGRYVRITFLGQKGREQSYGSIREFEVLGTPQAINADALRAPIIPENHPDTEWLKDITFREGFSASIFARPPAVNYPIFISTAPDGTLYVGSDGNGSSGRDPSRGRILRLRDLDGDGRADESKVFAMVDSPRGVAIDGNRLYVLHPPDVSVFIDKNGDGISDEKRTLVKGIGFGIDDRPIDHASNGIELGIDGWIYCAIGDFGMLNAEGTDGRKLTLRGGGVVRVRTDGTGLELHSRGTRNILEAAVSPLLDIFARDNTNDGDGWDVRFHHSTALGEHGYPTLFKNYTDETILPLAIYGGGSGMGSAWIDEPWMPKEWNNAPFTCDWGRNLIYRHGLTPKGATFTTDQREFFGSSRVNDLDADAQGHIYVASWKGAGFGWAGPEAGYLVRVVPNGRSASPVPDFAKSGSAELVKRLESPSARIRLDAQRALIAKGSADSLLPLAADKTKPLATRIAALFALKQIQGAAANAAISRLAADETLAAWALRALTDHEGQLANVSSAPALAALKSPDARTRREAIVALVKLNQPGNAAAIAPLLADTDAIVAHTAMQGLRKIDDGKVSFSVIDDATASPATRAGAFHVIRLLHVPAVVDGLLARLKKATDAEQRKPFLIALCRLSAKENPDWDGGNWGTRPDSRGPYYSFAEWSETKRINEALLAALNAADAEESKFLSTEFARHRIKPGDATAKLVGLAKADASLVPILAKQFGQQTESAPQDAVPLFIALASDLKAKDTDRLHAVKALNNVDDAAALRTSALVLGEMQQDILKLSSQARTDIEGARKGFINSTQLDDHHAVFEKIAAEMIGKTGVFADAALIKIAGHKFGSPEPRDAAMQALQTGLKDPKRALQIMEAMRLSKDSVFAELLLPLLSGPDTEVVRGVKETFAALKLSAAQLSAAATAPAIASMKTADVIAAVMKLKGDPKRGEQLFTQQGCVACHTVNITDPLKGPYLGNIANIYQRPALAEAILEPNKSIAQGFATNTITLKDGSVHMGFVTLEAADKVMLRNIASQEITINTVDIAKREKSETLSLMPTGLASSLGLQDFASLLDYLEALAKETAKK